MSSTNTKSGTNAETSTSTSTKPSSLVPASTISLAGASASASSASTSASTSISTSTSVSASTLCAPSAGLEDDWKNLYEASFPQDERMPVTEVRSMLAAGNILLHKTTDSSGALQCFSLVTPLSNFLLLAYIATDQTKQSSGVGSKHMKSLIDLLKKLHPTHLGLFLEIEATHEQNLSPVEDTARKRRLAFYQRLSCQRLTGKVYLLPSYTPGLPARQGELLWFEFGALASSNAALQAVISEIYTRGYNITSSDPSYVKVLSQFTSTPNAVASSAPVSADVVVPSKKADSNPLPGADSGSTSGGASGSTKGEDSKS